MENRDFHEKSGFFKKSGSHGNLQLGMVKGGLGMVKGFWAKPEGPGHGQGGPGNRFLLIFIDFMDFS